jgi:NADH:ubiquinone oxidoreductase subunit F (NADH-binding)
VSTTLVAKNCYSPNVIDIFDRAVVRSRATKLLAEIDSSHPFPALLLAQKMGSAAVLEVVRLSGLRGKGGAAYPTYRKLGLMVQQTPEGRCVVINGSEHEPGSDKDRYLLERYPETVLEGALILAHATGAASLIVAVKKTAVDAILSLQSAVNRLMVLIGPAIKIVVVPVEEAYLVGEESALLSVLEKKAPLPRGKPPFPTECGINGSPTLIQNVETAAHLPFIVSAGVEEYLSLGRSNMAVTLCTFGAEFKSSGVRLVPLGISMRELISEFGGGLRSGKRVKAVQPGGPGTGFLSHDQLEIAFSYEALGEAGSAIGCAAIRAFSWDDDMVKVLADLMEFFAMSSCGQCPGCRMETQMLSNIMKQTLSGRGSEKLLRQIPAVIKNANAKPALCGLIKMPAPAILTALTHFADEFARPRSAAASSVNSD